MRLYFLVAVIVLLLCPAFMDAAHYQDPTTSNATDTVSPQRNAVKGKINWKLYHQIDGSIEAAQPASTPPPVLDAGSRGESKGTVELLVAINETGTVDGIEVLRGLGSELNSKAVAAVGNWRFKPAMKKNRPIAIQVVVEVNFVAP